MGDQRLVPVRGQAGNTNAATHGAWSEVQIRPKVRTVKARFLRQNRLHVGDLSAVQRGYLDAWARCAAKVELIDRWLEHRGLIREDGELQVMKLYVSLVNSSRLSLARLEDSMRHRESGATTSDFYEVDAADAEFEELGE